MGNIRTSIQYFDGTEIHVHTMDTLINNVPYNNYYYKELGSKVKYL